MEYHTKSLSFISNGRKSCINKPALLWVIHVISYPGEPCDRDVCWMLPSFIPTCDALRISKKKPKHTPQVNLYQWGTGVCKWESCQSAALNRGGAKQSNSSKACSSYMSPEDLPKHLCQVGFLLIIKQNKQKQPLRGKTDWTRQVTRHTTTQHMATNPHGTANTRRL